MTKLMYTAKFHGPKPEPNQFQIRLNTTVTVEVFQETHDRWKARCKETRAVYPDIQAPSDASVKKAIAAKFETQLTDWEMTDTFGARIPDEKTAFLEKRAAPTMHSPGQQRTVPRSDGLNQTLCGKPVHADLITTEGEKPTCAMCLKLNRQATAERQQRRRDGEPAA